MSCAVTRWCKAASLARRIRGRGRRTGDERAGTRSGHNVEFRPRAGAGPAVEYAGGIGTVKPAAGERASTFLGERSPSMRSVGDERDDARRYHRRAAFDAGPAGDALRGLSATRCGWQPTTTATASKSNPTSGTNRATQLRDVTMRRDVPASARGVNVAYVRSGRRATDEHR